MLDATAKLPLKDPELFRQANYIAGKWVKADSGKTLTVRNPATGEPVGEVPAMGAAETRRAIEAAHAAQPAWRAMLAKDRAAILRKLNDLMLANADDLAAIMTAEQGKPLAESKGEVAYAASFIEWFAEEGKRVYGDTIPQNAKGRRIIVQKEPIGVFAAIAVILASVGLYSVLSTAVRQRTSEIGVRMAFGAEQGSIFRMMVGQGMKLSAIGIGVGLALAFGLVGAMQSMLVGVEPTDPATFGAIAATFIVIAIVACGVPALRAARMNPLSALRDD